MLIYQIHQEEKMHVNDDSKCDTHDPIHILHIDLESKPHKLLDMKDQPITGILEMPLSNQSQVKMCRIKSNSNRYEAQTSDFVHDIHKTEEKLRNIDLHDR